MKIDILVFGAHPDDVELGCAGTILLQKSLGYNIGVIDLTRGELGTRGSVETRDQEATKAAQALGLTFRENLGFEDGFFANNQANKIELIKRIRYYQPNIVLCNAKRDRHPDHVRAAQLVYEACFLSGLEKITTTWNGMGQNPFRPNLLYNYVQYDDVKPDFIVDISKFMDQKMRIIKLYRSQFYNPNSTESKTLISKKNFLELVVNRSADLGRFIDSDYAEGFCVNRYLGVDDLFKLM